MDAFAHLRIVGALVAALSLSAANASPPASNVRDASYRVFQSLPLESDGGSLLVEVDARLSPDEKLATQQRIEIPGLLPARIRIVDAADRPTSEYILWTQAALAKVTKSDFIDDGRAVYFVEGNDNAGFGSYSGKTTLLFTVADLRLRQLMAKGPQGKIYPIVLPRQLKSDWRIVSDAPRLAEIERVRCAPDFAKWHDPPREFLVTFTTYRKTAGDWVEVSRQEAGFWESDRPFPERARFP